MIYPLVPIYKVELRDKNKRTLLSIAEIRAISAVCLTNDESVEYPSREDEMMSKADMAALVAAQPKAPAGEDE
jgi:hypothetical protein